jgi:hypothetical protein
MSVDKHGGLQDNSVAQNAGTTETPERCTAVTLHMLVLQLCAITSTMFTRWS